MINRGCINITLTNENYINIKYCLAKTYDGIKSTGTSNMEEDIVKVKQYLLSLTERSSEKEIILKSTMPNRELDEIRHSLSNRRKDITFLIEKEEPIKRKPVRRNPNFHNANVTR